MNLEVKDNPVKQVLLIILFFIMLDIAQHMERDYEWLLISMDARRHYFYPLRYFLLIGFGYLVTQRPIVSLERVNIKYYVFFPLMILGLAFLAAMINVSIDKYITDQWLVEETDPLSKTAHLILAVCLAPILEEVFFRGVLFRTLIDIFKSKPWIAILIGGLFFGIVHIHPSSVVTNCLTGTAYCFIYWKTRNITVSMFCHFIQNGLYHLINY